MSAGHGCKRSGNVCTCPWALTELLLEAPAAEPRILRL